MQFYFWTKNTQQSNSDIGFAAHVSCMRQWHTTVEHHQIQYRPTALAICESTAAASKPPVYLSDPPSVDHPLWTSICRQLSSLSTPWQIVAPFSSNVVTVSFNFVVGARLLGQSFTNRFLIFFLQEEKGGGSVTSLPPRVFLPWGSSAVVCHRSARNSDTHPTL